MRAIGPRTYLASSQQVRLSALFNLYTLLNLHHRDGLDVMLKVVSDKGELVDEVEILKYLSSEPIKSDVDNPIVPLIEILHHDH
jgi:hypothetical protein